MRGQEVGANEACGGGEKGRVPRYPAPSQTPSRPQGSPPSPTPGPQRGRGCDPGAVSYKGGIFQHWGTLGSVT